VIGAIAPVRLVRAQRGERVFRVAIVYAAPEFSASFLERLRALGYREGSNLQVESASNLTSFDRLPVVAAEMDSHHPDVMFAGGGEPLLRAITQATGITPIVMLFVDFDPVAKGHVASLARPGGNVTGIYLQQLDVAAKKLQLLKEAVPSARRVAVLFDISSRDQYRVAQSAAPQLGVTLLPRELQGDPYDFEGAVRSAAADQADAVLILSSGAFYPARHILMNAIQQHRLPSMGSLPFQDAGTMLCYSANFHEIFARAADYVDRIFRGQKPAEMAIEQPTKLEFVINLRTAKSLDIVMPESLLRRADVVIR
jgi:putative ABC transport system substrate-binding protein